MASKRPLHVGSGEVRKMDKLFNSHWFVKIISFFIALMLFTMVNLDNFNNKPGVLPTSSANYTIDELEVKVIYDEENYAVIDQTKTVKVNLRGAQSDITLFQLTRPKYEVYVDVTGREEGAHTVTVEHRGFPKELTVSIVPQFAQVVLEEKQTVSLPVQVELKGEDEVEEGYTVGTSLVTPVNVDVTAARSIVSKVASAKVFIDVTGANKTIEETVPIVLYDASGLELELPVEPAVVDVRVPVTSPNRSVPTKVTRIGELMSGLSIEEIQVEPAEVTIYGPRELIERLNVVEIGELNLGELTESGTYEMRVKVPPGVEQVSPETVNVTVTVGEEKTMDLEQIPIEIMGLSEGKTVVFASESDKTVTVIAKGTASSLAKLTETDIQAFIDVSELSEGEHQVPIEFNGPANIRLSANERTIPIVIK